MSAFLMCKWLKQDKKKNQLKEDEGERQGDYSNKLLITNETLGNQTCIYVENKVCDNFFSPKNLTFKQFQNCSTKCEQF